MAAQDSLVAGMVKMGEFLISGKGTNRDVEEALKWYKIAALSKKSNEALNSMGGLFEKGIGVEKDTVEAIRWYVKAYKQGSHEAIIRLSNLGFDYNELITNWNNRNYNPKPLK